jgi:hypothetical protein
MNEKEELHHELQWVLYRQRMLEIVEQKLLRMKEIAEQAKEGNMIPEELETLNEKLNNLAVQINALDEESRKIKHEGIDI